MKDLIIAVADGYMEKVMEALLPRIPLVSNTCAFTYDIVKNPGHDPGSYNDSHELLHPFVNQYRFSIVLFDYEGTGVEHLSSDAIENNVWSLLNKNGWMNRNTVIVIEPELENWMWLDNRHVQDAIGWERKESLYTWARQKGYIKGEASKPDRPKETFEEAMKISDTSKSAAIYKKIATNASYRNCDDKSFQKLINQLKTWFPINI